MIHHGSTSTRPPLLPPLQDSTTKSQLRNGINSLLATPMYVPPSPARRSMAGTTTDAYSLILQAGYREGITAGKASTLQKGFDQGFTFSIPYAREIGSLRGIATSLLALLTTAAGAKLSSEALKGLAGREEVIAECRLVVLALAKLNESNVLPADLEALEHARSHAAGATTTIEGVNVSATKEMENLSNAFDAMGDTHAATAANGLDECRARLAIILTACGMEGLLGARRY